MTTHCPSPLVRSAYVDGELDAAEIAALEAHLDGCAECRTRIAALKAERLMLRELLTAPDEALAIPPLRAPIGFRELLFVFAGLLAIGSLASALWSAAGAVVPTPLRWLSPLDPGLLLDSAFNLVVFLIREGSSMLTSVTELAASVVLFGLAAWAAAALVKSRVGGPALLSVLLVVLALPHVGSALEIRRDDKLTTVPAGQTVDDTLIALGETVSIDGDVNGDLLAFARRVTIRGNVSGDVITGAETVDISGTVGGNVFGGARALTLAEARVRGNIYAGTRELSVSSTSEVMGNAVSFSDSVNFAGTLGVDMKSFARELVIRGNVRRNVEAFAANVTVLPPARVGGNLIAHVDDPADVRVTDGTVIGTVDTRVSERFDREREPRNKYLTTGYYVGLVIRLGAAFLTGLLLLTLFPGLQTLSLAHGGAVLKAAGVGLVVAVTLPIVAVIAAVTIVGLPLTVIIGAAWLVGLYFAKAVVAQLIGRRLFAARDGATPHFAATLLAGLVLVFIASNLPWVGWLVGLSVTLVGTGMLAAYVAARWEASR